MAKNIIGLDIGGANLKAADAHGWARTIPFELWKRPAELAGALVSLIVQPPDQLCVTMTGELCDCFPTKQDGVSAILDAVDHAFPKIPTRVWSTAERWLSPAEARVDWVSVAAANWHVLATYAARKWVKQGTGLLVDIGSTTSDIIPLNEGKASSVGLTDEMRLESVELVYTGARRTPICSLVGEKVCAELFATTLDAYLLLGRISDDESCRDTADGRPATRPFAHARMARMLGGDAATISESQTMILAQKSIDQQCRMITSAIRHVADTLAAPPDRVIVCGSGAFILRQASLTVPFSPTRLLYLADHWSEAQSSAACAVAAAFLGDD